MDYMPADATRAIAEATGEIKSELPAPAWGYDQWLLDGVSDR
jgi:hypothetical protein